MQSGLVIQVGEDMVSSRDFDLGSFFYKANNPEACILATHCHFHTRCGDAIYSIMGPRYLKLLKWQLHKESISCKDEEPITLNHEKRE
jgi:hypothetical protein